MEDGGQGHVARQEFKYRILVVDDDPIIRETAALILASQGYEVRTSEDGFAALVNLRYALPDLIISDLRMPNMSGFELLSIVRRRFPQIPVIAISGEFHAEGPIGLLADAFLQKGGYRPEQLLAKVLELLRLSPMRPSIVKSDIAPVWTPTTDTGYLVLTCQECLRSFSCPQPENSDELSSAECLHCGTEVRFLRGRTPKKK
ncbi:response regulator [Acidobacteria bacterium AB60]|nr:response regulator [Acidobacteria bacterium AB60]